MIITCLLCGHEEEHEARGLGGACYQRVRRLGMLGAFAPRGRGRPRLHHDRRAYEREYKRATYARRRAA